jgi:hypothetical protein
LIWGNPGGSGNWNGEEMGRGRSVHERPVTRVDGIAPHKRRDSKQVRGTQGKGELARGIGKGEPARGITRDCAIT